MNMDGITGGDVERSDLVSSASIHLATDIIILNYDLHLQTLHIFEPNDFSRKISFFPLPEHLVFGIICFNGSNLNYNLSSTNTSLQLIQRPIQPLQTSSLNLYSRTRNHCTRFQPILQPEMEALIHMLIPLR